MALFRKSHFTVLAAITALTACNSPQKEDHSKQQTQETASKSDEVDIKKISEALGHFIGRNLKAPGIQFDLESIIKGMREGATGKPAPLTDEEYQAAMAQLQQKAYNSVAETNLEAAEKFMKENAHAKGVVEIVPGKLQFMVIEEGKGAVVQEHGNPQINYTGKYIDGTVFGTSESTGGPITVPMDQTIPGFSKGIAGMKEGEKRRLYVHPDLGYGKAGQLPPNSLLIFDIELVKAASPEKPQADDEELDDDLDNEQQFDKKETPAKKAEVPVK